MGKRDMISTYAAYGDYNTGGKQYTDYNSGIIYSLCQAQEEREV